MATDQIINAFPGYEYKRLDDGRFHNIYRGVDVGFGGYVYAEPGMYENVWLFDVGNMHGASILALNKFGEYTKNYKAIRDARMAIKHRDYDRVKDMFDGKFMKYLTSDQEADRLQNALKLVLNSTYGIAAATFDNPLRDPRDVNNIIALRGALFMKTLQDEIVKQGYSVVHIKTDSCKVPNGDPEIAKFILDFGRKYGYEFEHECVYERMCLVNDAVYIAKYDNQGVRNKGGKHAGQWTATGTQFQIPYVFKTLFSKEPLEFKDMCETKTVKSAIYLDFNEDLPDVSAYEEEQARRDYNRKRSENEWKKLNPNFKDMSDADLANEISKGHNYRFVGKAGSFCPVISGTGGGNLMRDNNGKMAFVGGTKGYRWKEAEVLRALGTDEAMRSINKKYYAALVDDAIATISEYGDFEAFVS